MDAIRAREPDKAERLARKHIAKAEKARLKLLGDQREERQSEDKAAKGKDAKDKS